LEVANLRRIELSEAIAKLPDIGSLDPKKLAESGQDDLFLCALGFEERTLMIPRGLSEANYACSTARLVVYSTNEAENQNNRESLRGYLESMADDGGRVSCGRARFHDSVEGPD